MASRSVVVTIESQPAFNLWGLQEAEDYLYRTVVPELEKKKVYLNEQGNCGSDSCYHNIDRYNQDKRAHKLFNVEKIQRAIEPLNDIVAKAGNYKGGVVCNELRHSVRNYRLVGKDSSDYALFEGAFMGISEIVIAMLLKGYSARFAKEGRGKLAIYCDFKAKYIDNGRYAG